MSVSPSASPHLSPYSPGEVVAGKYRLKRLLGEGGMGAVWEARNLALEIDVAVKLIRADLNKETFGVRLKQEARAAAKLVKGAKLIEYKGAPHGITDTHKDQLNRDLLNFLKE